MPEIDLDGEPVEYETRRSSEASRSRIDMDLGGISVIIPESLNLEPEELLLKKKRWVLEKKRELDQQREKIPDRSLEPGGTIPYLDEDHTIRVTEGSEHSVEDGEIHLGKNAINEGIRDALVDLYREEARGMYQEFVDQYEDEIESDYDRVYIRNQKTKWASCSSKKNLSFNLRLMMAPEKIVEYVTVHELVHLDVSDHSKKFWYKVRSILPDYTDRRAWLDEHGSRLVFSKEDII